MWIDVDLNYSSFSKIDQTIFFFFDMNYMMEPLSANTRVHKQSAPQTRKQNRSSVTRDDGRRTRKGGANGPTNKCAPTVCLCARKACKNCQGTHGFVVRVSLSSSAPRHTSRPVTTHHDHPH